MVTEKPQNISSVSKAIGIPTHTIRYWEKEFAPFFIPLRPNGGHRRYGANEIEMLRRIKSMLKDEKYSIAGARQKLRILASESPETAGSMYFRENDDMMNAPASTYSRGW